MEKCFEFLALRSPRVEKSDLIIGFGHFDTKIPKACCDLYRRGYGAKILFTGGIGAGTNDLPCAEADYFLKVALKYAPEIPCQSYIIENKSTNTAENLKFSEAVLMLDNPEFSFSNGIGRVIIVANAYRQRRVMLTVQKIFPHLEVINCPPLVDYGTEREMFLQKGEDLDQHLRGELKRLMDYPSKGFIAPCPIPNEYLNFI